MLDLKITPINTLLSYTRPFFVAFPLHTSILFQQNDAPRAVLIHRISWHSIRSPTSNSFTLPLSYCYNKNSRTFYWYCWLFEFGSSCRFWSYHHVSHRIFLSEKGVVKKQVPSFQKFAWLFSDATIKDKTSYFVVLQKIWKKN